MSVNRATILGRLGADPEIRPVPSGTSVGTLRVATNSRWVDPAGRKQEATEWHRVIVWGKLAEVASKYLTKGREVYIEGRIETRQWQDKEGQKRYSTEIVAHNLQLIGGTAGDTKPEEATASAAQPEPQLPPEVEEALSKF